MAFPTAGPVEPRRTDKLLFGTSRGGLRIVHVLHLPASSTHTPAPRTLVLGLELGSLALPFGHYIHRGGISTYAPTYLRPSSSGIPARLRCSAALDRE